VNWYLSPWVRFMANYVHSRRDPEGSLNAFMLRLQLGVR
jgi:phosphate-selective porin